jgi:hypothetical protein
MQMFFFRLFFTFLFFYIRFFFQKGPSNPIAGYLTQAPSKKIEVQMSPPPLEKDDYTGYPKEE